MHQKRQVCKVGKQHSWKRVVRCVAGPVVSGKGFSYKHGGKSTHRSKTSKKTKKIISVHKKNVVVPKKKVEKKVVAGMNLGDCYRFRAFDNKISYLGDITGLLFSKA